MDIQSKTKAALVPDIGTDVSGGPSIFSLSRDFEFLGVWILSVSFV